jgi:Ran GTPase-activating protein (RanGAP) involved in mRNA processing and transport
MSDSDDSTETSTSTSTSAIDATFLEFCANVRNSDLTIMPEPGQPFKIDRRSDKEDLELADALLENNRVTYLEFEVRNYTKSSAEAMAKYVRTSKRLQRIHMTKRFIGEELDEDMVCSFLLAFQESTSLKELQMELIFRQTSKVSGPSGSKTNLAFEHMLTHTQSLRYLHLNFPNGLGIINLAATRSGLEKNTSLRELTLDFENGTTIVSIFTSLCDHPLLRRLCLRGYGIDLSGLETLLLSDNSKITELDINCNSNTCGDPPMIGLTPVLQAIGRRPTLTNLRLHNCPLSSDDARLLQMAMCNMPSLQSLTLVGKSPSLGSLELAELAPALYHNTSIQMLDISDNEWYHKVEAAEILRGILRHNKTITTLDLSHSYFGRTSDGAVECFASGLGSNSTLLKIDLSNCALGALGNDEISILARTLGSRNTMLQKLALASNYITSTGVGVLLGTMEHGNNHPITDLDLQRNSIGNEGATFIARTLGNNALPNLTRLSLSDCGIRDDGFIALLSALEHNTSLLQLDLRSDLSFGERAFLALATSLPEIKVLQRLDLSWCPALAAGMPLLLEGLRNNTSLFRFHVVDCAPQSVPPTTEETNRCAGGWMQELERLAYRNRFRSLIRAPKERRPPRGVWLRALARVATLPDVIFEVLRSKPNLVPSEDREGKEEAAKDTVVPQKRKRGDE